MGRERKERTDASDAEVEEENGRQVKQETKMAMIKTTTRRRKRKQSYTLEDEKEEVKLTSKEKSSDHVSNSKRRKGLFSKAAQLCHLFDDTQIAILVLSKAGKPYGFGHTSVYDLLNDRKHYTLTSQRDSEGLDMLRKAQEYKNVTRMKNEIENEMRACKTLEELALFRNKYVKLNAEIEEELSRRHSYNDGRSLVSMHATSDVTTRNPLLASSESDHSTIHDGGLAANGGFGIGGSEWSLALCQNGGDTTLANPISSNIGGNFVGHEVVSDITWPNFTNPTNLCSATNGFGVDVGDTSLSNPTINGNHDFLRELLLIGLEHEVPSGNPSSDLTTTFCLTASDYGVEHGFDVGNTSSMGPITLDVGGNVLRELGRDKMDEIYCSEIIVSTMRSSDKNGNLSSDLADGISANSLPSTTSNYGVEHVSDVGNTSSMGLTTLDVGGNVLQELGRDKMNKIGITMSTMRSDYNSGNSFSDLTNGISGNSLPSTTSNYGVDDHGNSLRDSDTYFDLSGFDNFDWCSDLAPCNNGAMERVEPSSELVQYDSNEGYFSYLMRGGDEEIDPSSYQLPCNT